MDDCEFSIADEFLKNINFTGSLLVSSKKDDQGNFKVQFLERKPGEEAKLVDDLYEDNPSVRKIIKKEFYETLIFVLQGNSLSVSAAMNMAEYEIYNLKVKRNTYLISSLIGLSSAYPIAAGISMMSYEPGKAAILLAGGVILAISSMRTYMEFQKYLQLSKTAEKEFKQFVLDEGNKYVRKK